MAHVNPPDERLKQLLSEASTIALVGASANPDKASHGIMQRLQSLGYKVIPINPGEATILGARAFRSLLEIPDHVDIVDLFRPAHEAPGLADEAVAIDATGFWLQSGIVSEEAAARAAAGGLTVVMDACIADTHRFLQVPPKRSPPQ